MCEKTFEIEIPVDENGFLDASCRINDTSWGDSK